MNAVEEFEKWFSSTFLFSRNTVSPLLMSENKTQKARFQRIGEVVVMILNNPKKDLQEIRAEVAVKYFVSMRCALDYINYAKIVLEVWKNRKT